MRSFQSISMHGASEFSGGSGSAVGAHTPHIHQGVGSRKLWPESIYTSTTADDAISDDSLRAGVSSDIQLLLPC